MCLQPGAKPKKGVFGSSAKAEEVRIELGDMGGADGDDYYADTEENRAFRAEFEQRKAKQDEVLDDIEQGVGRLGDIATDMGQELTKQDQLIDEVEAQVCCQATSDAASPTVLQILCITELEAACPAHLVQMCLSSKTQNVHPLGQPREFQQKSNTDSHSARRKTQRPPQLTVEPPGWAPQGNRAWMRVQMDTATRAVQTNNQKLKGVLHRIRSSRNFCIDIVLIIVLLSIAGYISTLLT